MDQLLTIKRNQIKMIAARGYTTTHEDWILNPELTLKEFSEKIGGKRIKLNSRYVLTNAEPKGTRAIFVYYVSSSGSKQIKAEDVVPFVNEVIKTKTEGILIINAALSCEANKRLLIADVSKYQIFKDEELLSNIMEHRFQPTIEIIEPKKGTKYSQLQRSDPLVKYFNFKQGQVIRSLAYYDADCLCDATINYHIVL